MERVSLGAKRSQLLGLVIRLSSVYPLRARRNLAFGFFGLTQGMAPVVPGLAAGIPAALLLGLAIRGLLFEVQPSDPVTIAGVAVVPLVVDALACLLPAGRAARTDAIAAFRVE